MPTKTHKELRLIGGQMTPTTNIKLFEERKVRSVWDETTEERWFSIVDVIAILTDEDDQNAARNYWKWLKRKLNKEGSQLVSDTNQLKLSASNQGSKATRT